VPIRRRDEIAALPGKLSIRNRYDDTRSVGVIIFSYEISLAMPAR
jgi:hypothetical protein